MLGGQPPDHLLVPSEPFVVNLDFSNAGGASGLRI